MQMARSSQPTRLPADVYDAAVVASEVSSRAVAQQIAHWARIGRELEMSPHVDFRAVSAVVGGATGYDDLDVNEQALVRASWAERMIRMRSELDYAAEFTAAGESYSEVDAEGRLVIHPARD